jgi:hypothetical protein
MVHDNIIPPNLTRRLENAQQCNTVQEAITTTAANSATATGSTKAISGITEALGSGEVISPRSGVRYVP